MRKGYFKKFAADMAGVWQRLVPCPSAVSAANFLGYPFSHTFTPSVEPLGTFMLGAFGFRAPQGPCTMHFSTASCAAG